RCGSEAPQVREPQGHPYGTPPTPSGIPSSFAQVEPSSLHTILDHGAFSRILSLPTRSLIITSVKNVCHGVLHETCPVNFPAQAVHRPCQRPQPRTRSLVEGMR